MLLLLLLIVLVIEFAKDLLEELGLVTYRVLSTMRARVTLPSNRSCVTHRTFLDLTVSRQGSRNIRYW